MDGDSTSRRIEQLIDQESSERMTQMTEDSVSRKATEIIACINNRLQSGPDLDGEIQRELGRSINFLTDVALTDTLWLRNRQVLDAIGLSVEALLSDPPKEELATSIQEDLQERLHPTTRHNLWRSFKWSMRSSPSAVVVTGLGILFYFLLFPALVFSSSFNTKFWNDVLNVNPTYLLLIGLVGGLGSIVSIMMRVRTFAYAENRDPWPFFFFGLFKPIVGAVFALFLFAAINAALIPAIKLPEDTSAGYFFVALSFVAGFSERFAGDAISSIGQRFGGSNPKVGPT